MCSKARFPASVLDAVPSVIKMSSKFHQGYNRDLAKGLQQLSNVQQQRLPNQCRHAKLLLRTPVMLNWEAIKCFIFCFFSSVHQSGLSGLCKTNKKPRKLDIPSLVHGNRNSKNSPFNCFSKESNSIHRAHLFHSFQGSSSALLIFSI